jgi:hypothetical protein
MTSSEVYAMILVYLSGFISGGIVVWLFLQRKG